MTMVCTIMLWRGALLVAAQAQRVDLIDPISRYAKRQLVLPSPGFSILQSDFVEPPDCGEGTYQGSGRLQGLNVLITGGDSGIGRAAAIAFAREGANVAINYQPDEEPDAEALASFLAQENLSLVRIPGDLTNETFCSYLVEEAASQLGGLDILVGNAGYSSLRNNAQPVTNQSTADFERVFRTNVFANVWLTAAAVPLLPRGGSIVFTASAIVASPNALTIDYGASKATITHLTRSLAIQLAARSIRVNAVAPGLTFTPFLSTQSISTEMLPGFTESPYGRIMQPAEIATLYVSLVDPLKISVSGQVWASTATVDEP